MCKVHYCDNKRDLGRNGQLMNYCFYHKKLNLMNPSATWEAPHIFFKNEIIFNDITKLKCNYDIWGDGSECNDNKQKYLAVPDIDKNGYGVCLILIILKNQQNGIKNIINGITPIQVK